MARGVGARTAHAHAITAPADLREVPTLDGMRWLIGVDLGERSKGALQMGAWMCAQPNGKSHELVIVHVIDERIWGPHYVAEALRPSAEQQLRHDVTRWGAPTGIVESLVVTAPSVEAGLSRVASTTKCRGIMIGRHAPRGARAVVRLGGVARRMLRQLPLPIMVVPPDMSQADVGKGRMVLGAALDRSSISAAHFAVELAAELARELLLVHVAPPDILVPDYGGGGAVLIPRLPRHERSDVEAWARDCGVSAPEVRVAEGAVVDRLLEHAHREAAPILAVGSRELSLTERIFVSSTASDLARNADRAVLVVPAVDHDRGYRD